MPAAKQSQGEMCRLVDSVSSCHILPDATPSGQHNSCTCEGALLQETLISDTKAQPGAYF